MMASPSIRRRGDRATFSAMTTQAMAALPVRGARDALLAGLAGVVTPYLGALAWSIVASTVWGAGLRVTAFVDPTASRPTGYLAASLVFAVGLGALLGAALAPALSRRAAVAWWGLWAAFAAGVILSAAGMGAVALRQPVLLLFIVSSALGFRFGTRR
jgi:hypothetical protein